MAAADQPSGSVTYSTFGSTATHVEFDEVLDSSWDFPAKVTRQKYAKKDAEQTSSQLLSDGIILKAFAPGNSVVK